MMRTTSEKFKSSSHLLNDAIKIHEEREQALLATNQKLQEQIEKLQIALEKSEEAHEKKHLIDQTKIWKLEKGIENFSIELKAMSEDMKKICERTIRREAQVGICAEASNLVISRALDENESDPYGSGYFISQWAHLPGNRTILGHFNFLKSKLDDEYKEWAESSDPFTLFSMATKADMEAIHRKLANTLKEYQALAALAKDAPQEAAAEQN